MLKSPASCALGDFCPAETEVEMVTSLPKNAYVFGCVFFVGLVLLGVLDLALSVHILA